MTNATPDRREPSRTLDRRTFIKASVATAWALPAVSYARVPGANARLNVAFIGVGGIASGQHIPPLHGLGAGCPCYCDIDTKRQGAGAEKYPAARAYTDYRRMYDAHMNEIDAVMVGTPDHHHYPATIIAMMEGKHAYTQKPLTHTPWEARQLAIAQRKYKVATQMGNQGHAWEGTLRAVDYLRSGIIGDIREAHIWTDRPWWRQGLPRHPGTQPVPENIDWESWIGPAPMRPFLHDPADNWGGVYHPFNWRGFRDFGCGALGDMACHEVDPIYWALEPGYPTAVELIDTPPFGDADMFPRAGTVRYDFPAKAGRPGFALYWYEGGRRPPRPAELGPAPEQEGDGRIAMTGQGGLYIGTKGKMISMPQAREQPKLLPYSANEGVEVGQYVERSIGHHEEWYEACIGNKPYDYPRSGFNLAAPFTEALLLGCIVERVGGRLEYDADSMTFKGNSAATALLTKQYRKGWEFKMA